MVAVSVTATAAAVPPPAALVAWAATAVVWAAVAAVAAVEVAGGYTAWSEAAARGVWWKGCRWVPPRGW